MKPITALIIAIALTAVGFFNRGLALAGPLVRVEAYIFPGMLCPMHKLIESELKEIGEKYGEEVEIEVINLRTPGGKDRFEKLQTGSHIAVLIAGKYRWNIAGREAVFAMPGLGWERGDLEQAVGQAARAIRERDGSP
jgi:hypothetical protein